MPNPSRPSRLRPGAIRPLWLMVAALVIGAGGVVVGWSVGAPPVAAAGCGPAPQGQVAVVMVVDRGNGAPSTRCAFVAQGATGLDALRAAGHDVRLDGGFVCGIDGLPSTGCGNRPDAGFAYWRYWHAPPGGAWSYSQVGAGGYRLPARCAVEGWVWSDSPSSNTPPAIAAPSPTCEAPVTTAAPTVPASPATTPGSPAVPAGGAPAPPAAGTPSVTTPPAVSGTGPAAATDPGAPPSAVAGETTVPSAGGGVPAEDPTGDADSTADGDAASSGSADLDDSSRGPDDESTGELAAAADGAAASGAPWGVVVTVVLVAGLGGAAVWRSRRRAARPTPT